MLNKRDKRGQGLQISTIILIILGVAILVFLIYGFVVGWDKLLPWINPGNNVDSVVSQCQVACATNSVYGFCTQQRTLKAIDLPTGVKEKVGTCKEFSILTNAAGTSYGIATCSSLTCP
jgi:uncharacterized protein with PQ loop repeat